MRQHKLWTRMACIAMTALIAGTMLAGCGSTNETAQSDSAATEGMTVLATEAMTVFSPADGRELAKDSEARNPALATESGPAKESDNSGAGLAEFVYVGNSEENRLLTKEAKAIAEENYDYKADGSKVMIPAFTIAEETEEGDDLQLLATIWVYIFELDGTTLQLTSGGSYPCRIHSTAGEITSVEMAYTDSDTLALCGGDETLEKALMDDAALDASLKNNVGMYVNNFGYNIDGYSTNGSGTVYSIN